MAHPSLTLFIRTICFSLARKHRLLKLLIPFLFMAISILLFLKIQRFSGGLEHNSRHKTVNVKFWNDELYFGRNNLIMNDVSISNLELFNRAVILMNGNYSNASVGFVKNNNTLKRNNSIDAPKMGLQEFDQKQESSHPDQNHYVQHIIRSTTETSAVPRLKQNIVNRGKMGRFGLKEKVFPVFAVIIVISRPNNVLLRLAARKTWARDAEMYKILVRYVVGRQEDWSDIVDRESMIHKDVIIFEENDTNDILPSKVIQGFEWALHLRPTPLYVMKIDDDTIVNLPYLTKILLKPTFSPLQILGAVRTKAEVIRDPENKWAVSILDYPSSTYPPYVFGGGYVMHSQTAKILLERRYYTHSWVHLEDVYLTGLVAAQAGVSIKFHRGFSSWYGDKPTACDFVQDKIINSVNNTERDFYELYKGIQMLLRSNNDKNNLCV